MAGPAEPSHKELNKKLRALSAQVAAGSLPIADPKKFRRDMELLEVDTPDELRAKLTSACKEMTPEHYAPPHKRKKSYEDACYGAPMFDFVWDSSSQGRRMYLKFAVKHEQCWLISFHPDTEAED
jgi:hypothetical protein